MSQPVDKHTVVYILFCLLLDASDIAFGMGWLRISTFTKRLARRTDARWKTGFSAGELPEASDPDEVEAVKVEAAAAVAKLEMLASDGCLTGDCPHVRQSECDAHLAAVYKETFGV